MKKTATILLPAVAFILFFSALLFGWTKFLVSRPAEAKTAPENLRINERFFALGAPAEQKKMEKKFSPYQYETGSAEKKALAFFTPAKSRTLLGDRKNGVRNPLSSEEILYLISDSIRLYESYDRLILTDAYETPVIPAEKRTAGASDHVISCYHGDYTEFSYYNALCAYQNKLSDIRTVILYRVWLLDSGTNGGTIESRPNANGDSFSLSLSFPLRSDSINPAGIRYRSVFCLMLDGQKREGRADYNEYYRALSQRFYGLSASPDAPLLLFSDFSDLLTSVTVKDPESADYRSDKAELDSLSSLFGETGRQGVSISLNGKTIFPTEELKAQKPVWSVRTAELETDEITITVLKNGQSVSRSSSTFRRKDIERLIASFGDPASFADAFESAPHYAASASFVYTYEIDLNNGTKISAPLKKSASDYLAVFERSDSAPLSYVRALPSSFWETLEAVFADQSGGAPYPIALSLTDQRLLYEFYLTFPYQKREEVSADCTALFRAIRAAGLSYLSEEETELAAIRLLPEYATLADLLGDEIGRYYTLSLLAEEKYVPAITLSLKSILAEQNDALRAYADRRGGLAAVSTLSFLSEILSDPDRYLP